MWPISEQDKYATVQLGELLQPSPLTPVHELIIWLMSTISPKYDEYY